MILRPYRDKPRHERSSFGNFYSQYSSVGRAMGLTHKSPVRFRLLALRQECTKSSVFSINDDAAPILYKPAACGNTDVRTHLRPDQPNKNCRKIQKCRIRSVHHLRSKNDGISAVMFGTIIRLPELVHIAHAFITCIGEMPEGISSLFGVEAHLDVKSNLCIVSM